MPGFLISLKTTEPDYPSIPPRPFEDLDHELDLDNIDWTPIDTATYDNLGPIIKAKAQPVTNRNENCISLDLSGRYKFFKPLWVSATIEKCHLPPPRTGEYTFEVPKLKDIIIKRGIAKDDCGHIIAASLGGKMVDINLFPQNQELNRGWKGNYFLWRIIEECMRLWVKQIHEDYNPRVEFQMLLYYKDKNNPDRPNQFRYKVRFLMDDRKRNEKFDNDVISLSSVLFNISNVALQCKNEHAAKLIKEIRHIREILPVVFNGNFGIGIDAVHEFFRNLEDLVKEIRDPPQLQSASQPQPSPPPQPSTSSTSSTSTHDTSTSAVHPNEAAEIISFTSLLVGAGLLVLTLLPK